MHRRGCTLGCRFFARLDFRYLEYRSRRFAGVDLQTSLDETWMERGCVQATRAEPPLNLAGKVDISNL